MSIAIEFNPRAFRIDINGGAEMGFVDLVFQEIRRRNISQRKLAALLRA